MVYSRNRSPLLKEAANLDFDIQSSLVLRCVVVHGSLEIHTVEGLLADGRFAADRQKGSGFGQVPLFGKSGGSPVNAS